MFRQSLQTSSNAQEKTVIGALVLEPLGTSEEGIVLVIFFDSADVVSLVVDERRGCSCIREGRCGDQRWGRGVRQLRLTNRRERP
jgi:hypothetical protein